MFLENGFGLQTLKIGPFLGEQFNFWDILELAIYLTYFEFKHGFLRVFLQNEACIGNFPPRKNHECIFKYYWKILIPTIIRHDSYSMAPKVENYLIENFFVCSGVFFQVGIGKY